MRRMKTLCSSFVSFTSLVSFISLASFVSCYVFFPLSVLLFICLPYSESRNGDIPLLPGERIRLLFRKTPDNKRLLIFHTYSDVLLLSSYPLYAWRRFPRFDTATLIFKRR